MSTTLTTTTIPEKSPRLQARMVGAFYLLTFLMGGLFFFDGPNLGFIIDLTAAMFYIAATLLFYALNKEAQEPTNLTRV